MLDYANENDVVDKNYARTFKLSDNIIKDVEEERKIILTSQMRKC